MKARTRRFTKWFVKHKAAQLVGRKGFNESDVEDIEQDLHSDLLARLPKCESRGECDETVVARLVDHRIASIIASREAVSRDYRRAAFSLNEDVSDGEGRMVERVEAVAEEDYCRLTGRHYRSHEWLCDLANDVRLALIGVSKDLKELCRDLMSMNVSDICRMRGVSRGSVYEKIGQLREIFRRFGLESYVRPVPADSVSFPVSSSMGTRENAS